MLFRGEMEVRYFIKVNNIVSTFEAQENIISSIKL